MKLNLISRIVATLSITFFLISIAHSENKIGSSRTEVFDNPFFVIAENPQTKVVTGYLIALRTSPGRTDVCKAFFQGNHMGKGSVNIALQDAEPNSDIGIIESSRATSAVLRREKEKYDIRVKKTDAPGNCDWILSFLGEPSVVERGNYLDISIEAKEGGDWIGIRLAKAKRAYFYTSPDTSARSKLFVVAGDLLYVYQEKAGWYFVKYDGAKKETSGWIRKEDVLEIEKL